MRHHHHQQGSRCPGREPVTGAQWQLTRRVVAILERDIGRTDADLAAMLGTTTLELRPVVGALYRQHRVDRCWSYVVLPRPGAHREMTAA